MRSNSILRNMQLNEQYKVLAEPRVLVFHRIALQKEKKKYKQHTKKRKTLIIMRKIDEMSSVGVCVKKYKFQVNIPYHHTNYRMIFQLPVDAQLNLALSAQNNRNSL